MTRRRRLQFAALRRRAGRDGTSSLGLPNLHMLAFRRPTPCRRPLQIRFKNRSKIDLKFRPPKKCKIRPKVGPNGGPESAQFGLKSALAAFLGLLDLKNEPLEGPSEKASIFE